MPSLDYDAPFCVPATTKHTATMVMLHGLGDTGYGWVDIAEQFAPALPHVRFIFPNAPLRPISLNRGMEMPGWYDIASLEDINQKEDADGLMESKRYVEMLIQQQVDAGIPSERIVVGGFSQGGATALLMLRSEMKLAGILALSGYLPLRNLPGAIGEANKVTPVLMCHGDSDMVVAYHFGLEASKLLKDQGMKVDFKTYPGMGHSACPEELKDMAAWLRERLP